MSITSASTSLETSATPEVGYKTHSPELYAKSGSNENKYFSLRALDLLQLCFDTGTTDDKQFLDVGCGIGDFTREELLPRCLPCERIVAADVSGDMLNYAKKNFSHAKIVYDFLDIAEDVSLFLEKYGQFERIYSFFCLHWVKDKEAAIKNIRRLLAPGGECLLLFPIGDRTRKNLKLLREMERWKKYKKILEMFCPELPDAGKETDPRVYFSDLLKQNNFVPHTCEVIYMPPAQLDIDAAIAVHLSTNPLIPHLSDQDKEELSKDISDIIRKQWNETVRKSAYKFLLLVRASKSKE